MSKTTNWSVLKFGGSSVAEARHWQTIVQLAREKLQQGKTPLLVLSALKNVSNALEALLHQSVAGVNAIAIQRLQDLHYSFAAELGLDGEQLFEQQFLQLKTQCEIIYQQQIIQPKEHAKVLAYGELFSTILGEAYLKSNDIKAVWLDARELLISASTKTHEGNREEDDWHHFLSAECNYKFDREVSKSLADIGDVIVTQGFIAKDPQGETVLLGREGSDTSASYLAAIIGAKEIEIWTDVPGFFSTNPRELTTAKQLTQLSYAEARRMASFGAKVLHPRAIKPAQENNIPIRVKCIADVKNSGTLISADYADKKTGVFALVTQSPVTYIGGEFSGGKTAHLLMGLGYDVLIQNESDQQQLVLCFANSTRPEPDAEELLALITRSTDRKKIVLKFQLGLLTLIGRSRGEWLRQVERLLHDNDSLQVFQSIVFPEVGRLSLMLPQHQLHSALKFFHNKFID